MIDSKILRRRKGDRFIGLADIGSNTIHGVVYKVNNGDTTKILNHKDSTELISYICAGILSDDGIDRLCSEVKQLDDLFRLSECDEVDFFATSALRSAVNCDEALRIVREETGVCIRLIDGKQEARYDYMAMKKNCREKNAVGLDLGGGSLQAVLMENGELSRSTSLECGCLRIYNAFVKGILPTETETREIIEYIKYLFESDIVMRSIRKDMKALSGCSTYMIGGTARAFGKFHRAIKGISGGKRIYDVDADALKQVMDIYREDEGYCVYLTNKLFPERICTFLPGIIVFWAVTEFLGSRELRVIRDGIREGVLQHDHI